MGEENPWTIAGGVRIAGARRKTASGSDASVRASLRVSLDSSSFASSGAFYLTLVPIRSRRRGERRSLRTFAGASLRPHLAFNTRPRRLSTPSDAFELQGRRSTRPMMPSTSSPPSPRRRRFGRSSRGTSRCTAPRRRSSRRGKRATSRARARAVGDGDGSARRSRDARRRRRARRRRS